MKLATEWRLGMKLATEWRLGMKLATEWRLGMKLATEWRLGNGDWECCYSCTKQKGNKDNCIQNGDWEYKAMLATDTSLEFLSLNLPCSNRWECLPL